MNFRVGLAINALALMGTGAIETLPLLRSIGTSDPDQRIRNDANNAIEKITGK